MKGEEVPRVSRPPGPVARLPGVPSGIEPGVPWGCLGGALWGVLGPPWHADVTFFTSGCLWDALGVPWGAKFNKNRTNRDQMGIK